MANQLANETSPYLQQHKDNPVNWYPWGEAALSRARQENKPIFLSIGYSACHWCHVMAHESFENKETAQILNEHFINIKVDREERPDLDDIYMQAVVLLTGQGGWPLSVFLTPDLKPFYGGTYFPPVPRHGLPSFDQVLTAVIETWEGQQQSVQKNADILTSAIRSKQDQQGEILSPPDLDGIVARLHSSYDWQSGGWGRAPRFPQPMLVDFLIQHAQAGNTQAAEITEHLLAHMAQGGMYDLVGGGFHRYSTDGHWLIPHFEKMLYDNAQLALTYLHAYALTGQPRFKHVTEETLGFIQEEMTSPQGVFYASMDADTPEGEGRYYAWEVKELQELLSVDELNTLQESVGLRDQGNFEHGLNVLQLNNAALADEAINSRLGPIFEKLKTARDQRTPPGKDEKIITEWNGLAIRAFAEAGLLLNRPDFLQSAKTAASFILENLRASDGRLFRSWRDGQANQPGTLADYAALISALHAVYVIDFAPQLYHHMQSLFSTMQMDFCANDDLYYDAAANLTDLVVRPRSTQDNATPSGNAMAAYVHWLLSNYEHDPEHADRASRMVKMVGRNLEDYPTSFGYWLQVAGLLAVDTQQIALVSPGELDALQPFLDIYRSSYRPFSVIAARMAGLETDSIYPGLLDDRPAIDGKPTAYVCQGFVCQKPLTEPGELQKQIR